MVLGLIFCVLGVTAAVYTLSAAFVAGARFGGTPLAGAAGQSLTILKPLDGAPAGLEKALTSTIAQSHSGSTQFVFGVQRSTDPVVSIVEDLRLRYPAADMSIVMDENLHGANGKISNLINMISAARHEILVISDADIEVPPGWLSAVGQAVSETGIGVVSCFYAGAGECGWARFAAMGISYQFLPSAVLGVATGLAHPCFGSTIAIRRETLQEIGGFERFANTLADDYEIGRAVRAKGYRLAYPPLLVKHHCAEQGLREVWDHELRWARTIRTINPLGHVGSVLTHAVPLALIGAVLVGFSPPAISLLATVAAARLFLKYRIDHIARAATGPVWLLPARDVLSFAVFLASLLGGTVNWRGDRLRLGKGGTISQGE